MPGQAPTADAASALSRGWQAAVARPVLAILTLVILQHGLTIGLKDLWFSDEVRHGDVLRNLLEGGDWLALKLNGAFYPDKPPLYFWYLGALALVFGSTAPWVLYVGLAGTVLMLLLATHHMARRITGDDELALIAVLILASGFYWLGLTHYARMDMMFAAAIALAWTQVWRALDGPVNRRAMLWAFGWMAVAAMIKGPVGPMLPLLSLAGWALWQRRAADLLDRSVLGGVLLLAGVIGVWAGGVVLVAGPEFFAHLFQSQIVDRGLNRGGGGLWGWLRYGLTLPLVFLPWTLLFLVRRGASPLPEQRGTAFLWLTAGLGALSLSLVSEKHEYYLVPLFVPLAILAAGRYRTLSAGRLRLFWGLAVAVSMSLGALFVVAPRLLDLPGVDLGDYGPLLGTLALPGVVLAVGAMAVWVLRRHAQAALLGWAGLVSVFGVVLAVSVLPPVNAVLSPRGVADAMSAHVAAGHAPGAFLGGDGTLAYHMGRPYADPWSSAGFTAWLDATPRAVAVLGADDWAQLASGYPGVGIVECTRLAGRALVIVARPAPEAIRECAAP